MSFSWQVYWGGLPFTPEDHVLSELSGMTHPSWVALHGMAHSFIDTTRQWSVKGGVIITDTNSCIYVFQDLWFYPCPFIVTFLRFFVFEFSAIFLCFTLVPLYIFKIVPVREIKFFCLPLSSWLHVMYDPPRSSLVVTDVTLQWWLFMGEEESTAYVCVPQFL